jgi:hypothetical protein
MAQSNILSENLIELPVWKPLVSPRLMQDLFVLGGSGNGYCWKNPTFSIPQQIRRWCQGDSTPIKGWDLKAFKSLGISSGSLISFDDHNFLEDPEFGCIDVSVDRLKKIEQRDTVYPGYDLFASLWMEHRDAYREVQEEMTGNFDFPSNQKPKEVLSSLCRIAQKYPRIGTLLFLGDYIMSPQDELYFPILHRYPNKPPAEWNPFLVLSGNKMNLTGRTFVVRI